MRFFEVRESLLKEANDSPNLLSDLAGLEDYISEIYHNRSFIELLQNADDAQATKFKIIKSNGLLYVANNGRDFTQHDFESLCRSAASNKVRGRTIGYRGIGFKSVVGFSKEIHILSGDLEATFSKERTSLDVPGASKVPLIRIPHELCESDRRSIEEIYSSLILEGYTTVFIFTGVTVNEIEAEFRAFEYNSLLFLKNIIETKVHLDGLVVTEISKTHISESDVEVVFNTNGSYSYWLVNNESDSSIAFSIKEGKVERLSPEESLIHAFLPTEDINGFGFIANGNFSTDPSRRHVIFDSETKESIEQCGRHIIKLLEKSIKNKDGFDLISALLPSFDPRMIDFMKPSFSTRLIECVKELGSSQIKKLKLCPSWLNLEDFHQIISSNDGDVAGYFYDSGEGAAFFKYLGAVEVKFEDLIPKINDAKLTVLGCVQLAKYVFKSTLFLPQSFKSEILGLKIFHVYGQRVSMVELGENPASIDTSYIEMLLDNGLNEIDIITAFRKYVPNLKIEKSCLLGSCLESAEEPRLVESNSASKSVVDWFNKSKGLSKNTIKESLKRWRSAEKQALVILNLNGFDLEDVSKQNVGYDLEGFDPDGNEIQIEVKSIALPGQRFKLTNNEIAVAQEKRTSFFVAIVRQYESIFEIALIPDPVNNLVLNRQCVQWVWECEDYEYKPMKFEL